MSDVVELVIHLNSYKHVMEQLQCEETHIDNTSIDSHGVVRKRFSLTIQVYFESFLLQA